MGKELEICSNPFAKVNTQNITLWSNSKQSQTWTSQNITPYKEVALEAPIVDS